MQKATQLEKRTNQLEKNKVGVGSLRNIIKNS